MNEEEKKMYDRELALQKKIDPEVKYIFGVSEDESQSLSNLRKKEGR